MHKKEPNENNRLSFRTILFRGILRVIIIPTCVILLLTGTLIGIFHSKYLIEAHQAQTEMRAYLEKKYHQHFIIKNYRIEGGGFARRGGKVADAHREGSSYTFRVLEKDHRLYRDNYLSALYNEQEEKDLTKMVKKLSIPAVKYIPDITIAPDIADGIQGTPAFAEMLRKYGDHIIYEVSIVVVGDQVKEEDVQNVRKLMEYVQSKNPKSYAVRYVVNSRTEDARYVCQEYGDISEKAAQETSKDCFKKSKGRI